MGAFLSLDDVSQVLLIRFEGVITDDVLLDHYKTVRNWIAAHGYYSQISDFSGITSLQVTARAINHLAASAPLVPDNYLRIVVAPQDNVFGMARMFEMLGSPTRSNVHIFRTIAEAYCLAGIEAPDFHPILDF